MLLPDTVGTGGDSHTRFPMGISFPAGSGLVAFAAATGVMPLDMPESVLVRFKGEMQPGITLRDLVHAIPYAPYKKDCSPSRRRAKRTSSQGVFLKLKASKD
jgi:aconitate hydratase 2/2-methylisocitrate dehydratase